MIGPLIRKPLNDLNATSVDNFISKPAEFLFGNDGKQNLDIETYKNKFLGANARAYLFIFKVQFPGFQNALKSGLSGALSNPGDISGMIKRGLMDGAEIAIKSGMTSVGTEDFRYFVKSTSLPESILEETITHWGGQQIKTSGVRRSQDWTVTFLVDNVASIIKKFWEWHLLMHNPETNMYGKPKEYMCDQIIQLLGINGSAICTYKLVDAWPKSIGQVALDYETNEFATVDITFTYQYHTITETQEAGGATAGRSIAQNAIRNLLQ